MEIKGKFFFDPSDRIYADHFPGNPVVPGSVIVKAFLEAGKEVGLGDDSCTIMDFRFRGFVAPGEHAFNIQFNSGQLKCRLFQEGSDTSKTLVTGIIRIGT
jgi:3-hydroxyacyl-[acyl-carrier-protein] dehydratase